MLIMSNKILVNTRWKFEVFSKSADRFLTREEKAAVQIGFTPQGVLFFPQHPVDMLLVHYSDMADDEQNQLLEGDIIECDQVTEFGSMVKRRGIVRYDITLGGYHLDVFNDENAGSTAPATNVKRIGNVFVDKKLADEVLKKEETKA